MDSSSVREVLKQPILVVGCGSIGKRHIRNLLELGALNVQAVDPRMEKAFRDKDECSHLVYCHHSLEEAFKYLSPIAALICTPTSQHFDDMLTCFMEGVPNVFVEKPVSDAIEFEGKRIPAKTLVACNFRFTPGLRKVKELIDSGAIGKVLSVRAQFGQYLPDQRENYQQSYAAHKSMGGGVILDRIHEFDYLTWLLGPISDVKAFSGHLSNLEIDTEDVAEIICRFEGGAIGNIHLDYIRRDYTCNADFIGEKGEIKWDCYPGLNTVRYGGDGGWEHLSFPTPINDMYLAELEHFLRVCAGEEESCNTVSDAYRLLGVVLKCKQ